MARLYRTAALTRKSVCLQRKSGHQQKQREYCISYIYKIGCIKDINSNDDEKNIY